MRVATVPRFVRAIVVLCLATHTAFAQNVPTSSSLVVNPGTILSVRINEGLSSDQNQPGDMFSGTLIQPVVVRGIVVAQRGQMVAGTVSEARKAGRVSGTSTLRLMLNSLTLVDGQTVPIQTQMITRNAPASEDRDAFAIGTSTALGAMIGAAAGWGRGAAIGAGTGAAVGTIGVLLTRGHPTVVYPESVLTFRILSPVTVSTEDSLQAFHAVNPAEYQQAAPPTPEPEPEREPAPQAAPVVVQPQPVVYSYPYPVAYPYPYVYPSPLYGWYGLPWYGYPRYYGPSFRVFIGRPYPVHRYYGPRFYAPSPRYYAPRYYGPSVGYRGHYSPPVVYRGPVVAHRGPDVGHRGGDVGHRGGDVGHRGGDGGRPGGDGGHRGPGRH